MSDDAHNMVAEIGDWYDMVNNTYIRIYGATESLHIIPKFVTDYIVLAEIAYQTYGHGVGEVLERKKKDPWPNFPIIVGSYNVSNTTEAKKLGESIKPYHFGEERFKKHVPKALVLNYMCANDVSWHYTHETCLDEEPATRTLNWKNVQLKLNNKKNVRSHKAKTQKEPPIQKKQVEMEIATLPKENTTNMNQVQSVQPEAKRESTFVHKQSQYQEPNKIKSEEETYGEGTLEGDPTSEDEATSIPQDVFSIYHPTADEIIVDLSTYTWG